MALDKKQLEFLKTLGRGPEDLSSGGMTSREFLEEIRKKTEPPTAEILLADLFVSARHFYDRFRDVFPEYRDGELCTAVWDLDTVLYHCRIFLEKNNLLTDETDNG